MGANEYLVHLDLDLDVVVIKNHVLEDSKVGEGNLSEKFGARLIG